MLQLYVNLLKLYKFFVQFTVDFSENLILTDKKITIDKGIDLWYYSRNKKMNVDLHKLGIKKKRREKDEKAIVFGTFADSCNVRTLGM